MIKTSYSFFYKSSPPAENYPTQSSTSDSALIAKRIFEQFLKEIPSEFAFKATLAPYTLNINAVVDYLHIEEKDISNEGFYKMNPHLKMRLSFETLSLQVSSIRNKKDCDFLLMSFFRLKTQALSCGFQDPIVDTVAKSLMVVDLKIWTSKSKLPEEKATAALKIKEAFDSKMSDLDLNGLNLVNLPHSIGMLSNLSTLNVSNNALITLPNTIENLHNLTWLNACNNKLKTLPTTLGNLQNLEWLNASNNNIKVISSTLDKLQKLKTFYLSQNPLQKLPETVGNLENPHVKMRLLFESLSLEVSSIKDKKSSHLGFESFFRLKTEALSCDFQDPIVDNIAKSLMDVDLKIWTSTSKHPREKAKAALKIKEAFDSKRHELELNGLNLAKLPHSISLLSDLCTLNVSNNALKTLPHTLENLRNLKWLNTSHNKLRELPLTLGHLQNLEWLNVSDNNIEAIPPTLGKLKKLQTLYLSQNHLQKLPKPLEKLKNLQVFNVSKNHLHKLHNSLCNLQNLKGLDVSYNQLETLPNTLGNLKNLQVLNVSQNQLRSLPNTLGHLQKLEWLNVSSNQLETLPDSFSLLGKLQDFSFQNNSLTFLHPMHLLILKGLFINE